MSGSRYANHSPLINANHSQSFPVYDTNNWRVIQTSEYLVEWLCAHDLHPVPFLLSHRFSKLLFPCMEKPFQYKVDTIIIIKQPTKRKILTFNFSPNIRTLLVLDHCLLSIGVMSVDIPTNTSNRSGVLDRPNNTSIKALPSFPMSTECIREDFSNCK